MQKILESQHLSLKRKLNNIERPVLEGYSFILKIGEGSYGEVWKAIDIENQIEVAIKIIKLPEGILTKEIYTECTIISPSFIHQNIESNRKILVISETEKPKKIRNIKNNNLNSSEKKNTKIYIVMTLMIANLNKFYKHIKEQNYLNLSIIKGFLSQIAESIYVFHKNNRLHLDLKLENLLVSYNGKIVLSDYSLSEHIEKIKHFSDNHWCRKTRDIATLQYRSPEFFFQYKFLGPFIDIWSFGCIVVELLLGKPFIVEQSEQKILQKMVDCLGKPKKLKSFENFNDSRIKNYFDNLIEDNDKRINFIHQINSTAGPNAVDLVLNCLEWNIEKRIKIDNIVNHSFFIGENIIPAPSNEIVEIIEKSVKCPNQLYPRYNFDISANSNEQSMSKNAKYNSLPNEINFIYNSNIFPDT